MSDTTMAAIIKLQKERDRLVTEVERLQACVVELAMRLKTRPKMQGFYVDNAEYGSWDQKVSEALREKDGE